MILLGIGDFAKRWNYTRQGVQYDSKFPRPIAIINTKVLVFSLHLRKLEDKVLIFLKMISL